jgi:rhomboid protease GluP
LCASCGKLVGVQDEICLNCGRKNPGMFGFAPFLRRMGHDLGFTTFVVWGCAALYLATLLVDIKGIGMSGLNILSPSLHSLFRFGASGALPVFGYGRWWTVLSAGWLHGGLLHIVFNLMWVRQLAPATGELYGVPRMAIIYTISSICGFALSSFAGAFAPLFPIPLFQGAKFTIGASAPVFGLLGALVFYGRRSGSSQIRGQAMGYAVVMFVFGLVMPGIDNYAHLGGFLGGYVTARILDPFKPEKIVYSMIAIGLMAATGLSVLASLLQGILF